MIILLRFQLFWSRNNRYGGLSRASFYRKTGKCTERKIKYKRRDTRTYILVSESICLLTTAVIVEITLFSTFPAGKSSIFWNKMLNFGWLVPYIVLLITLPDEYLTRKTAV